MVDKISVNPPFPLKISKWGQPPYFGQFDPILRQAFILSRVFSFYGFCQIDLVAKISQYMKTSLVKVSYWAIKRLSTNWSLPQAMLASMGKTGGPTCFVTKLPRQRFLICIDGHKSQGLCHEGASNRKEGNVAQNFINKIYSLLFLEETWQSYPDGRNSIFDQFPNT